METSGLPGRDWVAATGVDSRAHLPSVVLLLLEVGKKVYKHFCA